MGLDGIKITWVNGKEPVILGWLRKMGKLGNTGPKVDNKPESRSKTSSPANVDGPKATLPQNQSRTFSSTLFSSFPSTFVRPCIVTYFFLAFWYLPSLSFIQPEVVSMPDPTPAPVAGIDYESLTLMRMRQAERERLEREILEQEANE